MPLTQDLTLAQNQMGKNLYSVIPKLSPFPFFKTRAFLVLRQLNDKKACGRSLQMHLKSCCFIQDILSPPSTFPAFPPHQANQAGDWQHEAVSW